MRATHKAGIVGLAESAAREQFSMLHRQAFARNAKEGGRQAQEKSEDSGELAANQIRRQRSGDRETERCCDKDSGTKCTEERDAVGSRSAACEEANGNTYNQRKRRGVEGRSAP